ncbi:gluconokinase [Tepidanaerobacter acetatoxydans]|uniref:gluconokinase n=1 Tax=Tepidanaerobacter acetatoxydans TaxID=499229 RepID=UPI001BD43869|nr:gluconokinase [Tepidanaerobacter acetatoxydans]
MIILALETSTSALKVAVYSSNKGLMNVKNIPYDESLSDTITQNAEGLYDALILGIKEILQSCKYQIDAISLSGIWHSLLLLDKHRKPITPIFTWADTRPIETVAKYRKNEQLWQSFYNKTGCTIHSIYPLWKIIHLKESQPEIFSKAAYFTSQLEYIFEQLTGEFIESKTIASGTGMFNIHTLDWDDDILNFAGIDRDMLCKLHEPTYSAPLKSSVAKCLNLPKGLPVIIGGADGALNQIGAGALKKGIMTLSVGTSGALRLAYDKPVLSENTSTWCYYALQGKRLAGAATSGAGNCLEWFKKRVYKDCGFSYKKLDEKAAKTDIENAPIFLPFLYGERNPGWQDNRRASFIGLKGHHEIGDLYHAVLEGVLFNLYQCYAALTQITGEPEEIRISGGIENSPFWLQMAADIFGRDIVTSGIQHMSTVGAAVLALNALGEVKDIEKYEPTHGRTYTPNKKANKAYEKRYETYLDYYQRTDEKR